MTDYVSWLKGLAAKGGKGVVNNIDARSLGRVAELIERLQRERDGIELELVQMAERNEARGNAA